MRISFCAEVAMSTLKGCGPLSPSRLPLVPARPTPFPSTERRTGYCILNTGAKAAWHHAKGTDRSASDGLGRFGGSFSMIPVGPPSHVLWNIKWPWMCIMTVTMGIIWWQATHEAARISWDRHGILKDTFRMTSFAMSLLLAFRVNRTYDRWKEARSSLSGVGTGATSIFLQAATWIKDPVIVEDFRRYCIVWPYSIKQVVQNSKILDATAAQLLHPAELAVYSGSRKGRQIVVTSIRNLAKEANLPLEQFMAMETVIQATWKSAGDALRVKFQAMPEGVTLMCTGFVQIWCLLLPFGLIVDTGHLDWIALVAVSVASILLLGCDEVANQMEDPFNLIPVDDIINTYERDINRVQKDLENIKNAIAEARETRKPAAEEPKPDSTGAALQHSSITIFADVSTEAKPASEVADPFVLMTEQLSRSQTASSCSSQTSFDSRRLLEDIA